VGRIIVATIVRNEADRYLPSALEAWGEFADRIVAIDNGSTDDTTELLHETGARIIRPPDDAPMWGNEAPFRKALYELAIGYATDDDVIFFLDADMVPLRDPSDLFLANVDVFSFNLYDVWQYSENQCYYRFDPPFWIADKVWRPWAVRAGYARTLHYDAERGIHCGHLPSTVLDTDQVIYAPTPFGLLHYGYATEEDRERAFTRYEGARDELSADEWRHVDTILHPSPQLTLLTTKPTWMLKRTR